jgi:hypothetical protein
MDVPSSGVLTSREGELMVSVAPGGGWCWALGLHCRSILFCGDGPFNLSLACITLLPKNLQPWLLAHVQLASICCEGTAVQGHAFALHCLAMDL